MLTRCLAAVAVAVVAVQFAPVAASADVVDSLGLPALAAQAGTCRLATSELYPSTLSATVERLASGEIDFTWHSFAHAGVSSVDNCVTGIKVASRLTDSRPVVDSGLVVTTSEDPFRYQSGGSDYEVDGTVDLPVAYFGGPGTTQSLASRVRLSDGTSPDPESQSLKCERVRSTVTEYDTAYYENSQRQFVPFCSEQVSHEFVSTPAGPEEVGDPIVESITC